MHFAGLDLSRRLERAEATASAKFVEARCALHPGCGTEWRDFGGTYAMFDGPNSPLSQTFGLGLFTPLTPGVLEEIEAYFHGRGAAVNHEVSPLAGVEVAALLVERGYKPIEYTSVLYRGVEAADVDTAPIAVRRARPEDSALWSALSAEGWDEHPELRDFLLEMGAILAATEGALGFIAELDEEPIATGVLRCDGGVALFGGASTIPRARNRGAQRALLNARMRHAANAGCDLAMMCASPGSASQRNAERQGFRIAYTRVKWAL